MSCKFKIVVFVKLILLAQVTLLAQSPCSMNPPFGLSASNTICAETESTTVSFTIYNLGSYDISFPDGTDTSVVNSSALMNIDHVFNFDCENMPGNPTPPNSANHFFSYENELVVTRTDCVDELGQYSVGYYNFNVVPNPISGFKPINSSCLAYPLEVIIESDICVDDLVKSYKWYIDGTPVVDSLNKNNLVYPFNSPGTYLVKLEVKDYFDCATYTHEQFVTVTAKPSINLIIGIDSSELCGPVITIQTINNSEYVDSYLWSSSSSDVSFSNSTSPNPTVTINNSNPGIYTFTVIASSVECGSVSKTFTIKTYDEQQVTITTPLLSCTNNEIDVCDFVNFSPAPASVLWSASNVGVEVNNSTDLCPKIISNIAGSFTLTVSGKDICNNDFTETIPIAMTPTQVVSITIDAIDTLCESGTSIQLLAPQYITPVSYIADCWGGGVSMSTGCIFNPSGHEGMNLITFQDSCGGESVMEIFVVSEGSFVGGNPELCIGETLDLFQVQAGSYAGSGVQNNIFNSLDAGVGVHTIQFDGTASFCGGTGSFTITVLEYPEAKFTIQNSSCLQGEYVFAEGETIVVSNLSSSEVFCYEILETQEKKCGSNVANFTFPVAGEYTIQQIVGTSGSGQGCQDTTTINITIEPVLSPSISVEVDSSNCDSVYIQFVQDTLISVYQYEWVFSNGESSVLANPLVSVEKPLLQSTFLAELKIKTYCSDVSYSKEIELFPRFQVSIDILNDNNTICSGEMVYFQNTSSNYDSLYFYYDDKNIPKEFVDSFAYYNTTDSIQTYVVKLKGVKDGCPPIEAFDTITIWPVNTDAAFSLDYPNTCSPFSLQLKNSSTIGAHNLVYWGDGSTPQKIDNLSTLNHDYIVSNDTIVQVYLISSLCGADTMQKELEIYSSPKDIAFEAYFIDNQCVGDSAIFIPSGELEGQNSIIWDFGDGENSQIKEPVHTYDTSGIYDVVLRVTNSHDCVSSYETPVEIFDYKGVPLDITVPNEICAGSKLDINIIQSELKMWIDYNNGLVSSEPIFVPYQEEGEFYFNFYSIDSSGCSQDTTVLIRVSSDFDVYIIPENDTIVDLGESIVLDFYTDPARNIDSIHWVGDNIDFPEFKIIQPAPIVDSYYIVEVVDEVGCRAKDSIFVWVNTSYDELVFIPNVFSPDDNGRNDRFYVFSKPNTVIQVLNFTIYDRWGNVVHQEENCLSNDPNCGWDGYFQGKPMNSGVFVYQVEVLFIDGVRRKYVGDLTLIR